MCDVESEDVDCELLHPIRVHANGPTSVVVGVSRGKSGEMQLQFKAAVTGHQRQAEAIASSEARRYFGLGEM